MPERYQVVTPFGSSANLDPKKIADLLAKDGQLVLPLLDLITTAQASIDHVIDVVGRASIQAVLKMSARTSCRSQAARQENRPRDRLPRSARRPSRAARASAPRVEAQAQEAGRSTLSVEWRRKPARTG